MTSMLDRPNPSLLVPPPHAEPLDVALDRLSTSRKGLGQAEADARLEEYGPNRTPRGRRTPALLRFLRHFHNALIYVLIGAAAVTWWLGHPIDTAVILFVVLANAVIGFIQEGRAEAAMEAIESLLSPHAAVYRDGRRVTVDAETVVPGDVVCVEAGDRIPADLRLIKSSSLRIQEAILTGESIAVEKSVGISQADAQLGDRTGCAFSGTIVTAGQAEGLVVATGVNTEIGRISGMLSSVDRLQTPLLRQMNAFAKWLTILILLIGAALLSFGVFIRNADFSETFMSVVGLSVAAIPEGLPAVLTITMAIGVRAMAGKNAIVRRLPAIETLGAVSVICTDKTGTLTRGKPDLVDVKPQSDFDEQELLSLVAAVERGSEHPLAHAIVEGAQNRGAAILDASDIESVTGEGIQANVDKRLVAIGNEKMMERIGALEEGWRSTADEGRSLGQTVMFVAVDGAPAGLIAVADPIKATSRTAIAALHERGIKIVMLTGDSEATARAVASQVGIDEVEANVSPEDKHRKIEQLKSDGRRVAMAGDGINDAPALAASHVGIAMGTGTDVAIESAGVTLVRGDLVGVVQALVLSRATMRNIRQNLFFAFAYNALGIPVAAGVLYPWTGLLLNPMIAAAAMSLSSVSVIGNALRLRGLALPKFDT